MIPLFAGRKMEYNYQRNPKRGIWTEILFREFSAFALVT